ncbi:GNAT family N-acetyltransferase [Chamaesiphon minutus]|uniref:Acetyltransferase, N-acetylglutamate synthase n=1 Tax=Chamaesiphon minutus (strain ATCC 27169 / PCC 6605) TaxID=1173020 RepID=K9UNN7_CHAP6|nr:GNAT family N-acetyltransferase [Chamaesiphon minutus]AFY96263.1 acetyltransferase, N-acetylglutamate synthase [Chamaesiphon minutus PCC 6605]
MDVNIRLASLADIPQLLSLIPESAISLQASYYTPAQIDGALGTMFNVDRQLIKDKTYFVAQSASQIVGCGGWSRRANAYGGDPIETDLEEGLLNPSFDAAKLRAFFVHPAWARKGIGSKIIRQSELAALAAGFQSIEIVATLAGEQLYCKFGYRTIDRFEISLPNNHTLPVVKMFKEFSEHGDR